MVGGELANGLKSFRGMIALMCWPIPRIEDIQEGQLCFAGSNGV